MFQGLVFSAVGSMVWRRSPNGLCRRGTLGTRTSDLWESVVAAVSCLPSSNFTVGTHTQDVGDLGFIFFSGSLHSMACQWLGSLCYIHNFTHFSIKLVYLRIGHTWNCEYRLARRSDFQVARFKIFKPYDEIFVKRIVTGVNPIPVLTF